MDKKTYAALLQDKRWLNKREDILRRDGYTCQLCGSQDEPLNIHHKYYAKDLFPWSYPDEALVTLCSQCHEYLHSGDSFEGIKVGDVFTYDHSDFTNICIVYFVDGLNGVINSIEYDGGCSARDFYGNGMFYEEFFKKCARYEYNCQYDMFRFWFANLCLHIDSTPDLFRINFENILHRNRVLMSIYKNKENYAY